MSFDDTNLILKTVNGTLSVDGVDLHIQRLDLENGELAVEGTVNGMYFISDNAEKKKKNGRLKRLFR